MKAPLLLLASGAVLTVVVSPGCSKANAQASTTTTQRSDTDRTLDLTIYKDDFALVRDTRTVDLVNGIGKVGLPDVSKLLDQNSVMFSWKNGNPGKVLSTTYELGVDGSSGLLSRFLGKEVDLVYRGENGREGERQRGVLQVADPGNIVVKVGDRFVVNPTATIETAATDGVATLPQLTAEVESTSKLSTPLEVNYLTRGLSWEADYTLNLGETNDMGSLEAWASITNRTGTEFPKAKLRFVAGVPNRAVQPQEVARAIPASKAKAEYDGEKSIAYQNSYARSYDVGELHAYPFESVATIRPDQMNRVRLMDTRQVSVTRDYSVNLDNYRNWSRPSATLGISFMNSDKNGLGKALPGGALRVYEPTPAGPAYIGAATIADTPRDGKIWATLTNVFDIMTEQKSFDYKKVGKNKFQQTFEVKLTNQKKHPVMLRVVRNLYNYTILSSSIPPQKGTSVQWKIDLKPGETQVIRYTIQNKS